MGAEDDVADVNRRYYDAFETADLDAMSALWEHSERAVCTHPGWSTLHGWAQVAASYYALFQGGRSEQFVLTREETRVIGDVGWVAVDENLLGEQAGVTVATLNVFVKDGGAWRMVIHHGSVVAAPVP